MKLWNAVGAILSIIPVGLLMWGGAEIFTRLDNKHDFGDRAYSIGIRLVVYGIGILGAVIILLTFFGRGK